MNRIISLTLGIFLLGTAGLALAQKTLPVQAKINAIEVGNKICPISHEEIGKNGMKPFKVTYKGKIYNLCCGMCEKDFNKNPEKYSKNAG